MTIDAETLANLSFGRLIKGRNIKRHIGPLFSMNKSAIRMIGGGRIHDQFETEMNAGLERLLEKARGMGGNGVVNVQFRELGDFRSYLMWGDVVILAEEDA